MEREFDFPGEPYQVQLDFMRNLYTCLDSYKVGIFESPTGTGKSLSLICSSFKWLKANQNLQKDDETFTGSQSWVNDIPTESSEILNEITNLENPENLGPEKQPLSIKSDSVPLKIIYISRTHTQLDQFANEIKKTIWNSDMRVVRLGSRSQLCVNPELAGFKSRGIIDFKCKELIDPNLPSTCPYYKSHTSITNHLLSTVCDIEDLVGYGKRFRACPYFGTRAGIPHADVILAPYTLILNERNRESIGMDLTNSILIIDEAHNIIEAMADCHSASVTKIHVQNSLQATLSYYERFGNKIGARSVMFFDQIIKVLRSIQVFISGHCANKKSSSSISIGDFLLETDLERVDLFKIIMFIEEIEFGRKVVAYAEKAGIKGSISSVPVFIEFLRALCGDASSGKILTNLNDEEGIRYLLVNPNKKFQELVQKTRCLILAGGTMEPKSEYLDLFSAIDKNKIKVFTCGHVINPENLLLGVVGRGDSGCELRFTFDNRDNSKIFNDLSELLRKVCEIVPNGVVVFLPSYFFLSKLKVYMEKNGVLAKIMKKKTVHFDNKDENILDEYSRNAVSSGALLFAVVRGRLSEGINFSDKLGRCVVMVGLPYLNKTDVEIQEKMKFLDANGKNFTGRMFYESSCHKAINQSIGRAIRHKNDYAVVLLVDERHSNSINRRPDWMIKNIMPKSVSVYEAISVFFKNK